MIEIVSATRLDPDHFWKEAPLGQSLQRLSKEGRIKAWIAFENTLGLPTIYNQRLNAPDSADVLLFVHDDVWIDDFFIVDRALEASRHYDLFGVVGNRRCLPLQPSWAFTDTAGTWDEPANLRGAIAHGSPLEGKVDIFGASPADCEVLDGVLLGVEKSAFKAAGLYFDERFDFHFYDVDLCLNASRRGLRIGVWPIAITHGSKGGFDLAWHQTYLNFCAKWQSSSDATPLGIDEMKIHADNPENIRMKQTPAHELINTDLLALVPKNTRRVVDVGCMHGQMALAVKEKIPAVYYTGIDIDPDYSAIAATRCDRAFAADIDQLSEERWGNLFPSDCWIFGDCLEHLKDPWAVLRSIRARIDSDGCVLICIPNAQHWAVQWRLMTGQFRYEDSGLLDRTHLRWFTRITLLELFQETGWQVAYGITRTLNLVPQQERVLDGIRAFAKACSTDPEQAVQDAVPFQYLFKLIPA